MTPCHQGLFSPGDSFLQDLEFERRPTEQVRGALPIHLDSVIKAFGKAVEESEQTTSEFEKCAHGASAKGGRRALFRPLASGRIRCCMQVLSVSDTRFKSWVFFLQAQCGNEQTESTGFSWF